MSTVTLLVISVLVCLQVQAYAQQTTIDQALQRGAQAEAAVRQVLTEKLPAGQEADDVLTGLRSGLQTCEQQLRSDLQFAAYNACVGNFQGLAMASIGELAGQYWASSGASRPTLFW